MIGMAIGLCGRCISRTSGTSRASNWKLLSSAGSIQRFLSCFHIAFHGFPRSLPGVFGRSMGESVSNTPSIVYPNSGEVWDEGSRQCLSGDPKLDLAAEARRWYQLGARRYRLLAINSSTLKAILSQGVLSAVSNLLTTMNRCPSGETS